MRRQNATGPPLRFFRESRTTEASSAKNQAAAVLATTIPLPSWLRGRRRRHPLATIMERKLTRKRLTSCGLLTTFLKYRASGKARSIYANRESL